MNNELIIRAYITRKQHEKQAAVFQRDWWKGQANRAGAAFRNMAGVRHVREGLQGIGGGVGGVVEDFRNSRLGRDSWGRGMAAGMQGARDAVSAQQQRGQNQVQGSRLQAQGLGKKLQAGVIDLPGIRHARQLGGAIGGAVGDFQTGNMGADSFGRGAQAVTQHTQDLRQQGQALIDQGQSLAQSTSPAAPQPQQLQPVTNPTAGPARPQPQQLQPVTNPTAGPARPQPHQLQPVINPTAGPAQPNVFSQVGSGVAQGARLAGAASSQIGSDIGQGVQNVATSVQGHVVDDMRQKARQTPRSIGPRISR